MYIVHIVSCLLFREDNFQCDNGNCVFEEVTCNGRDDCKDGSDETEKACTAHFCPKRAFQCAYGACIPSESRCNNKNDCIDGSDEIDCPPPPPPPPRCANGRQWPNCNPPPAPPPSQDGIITRVSTTIKEYFFRHVKELFSNSTKRENFHLIFKLEERPESIADENNSIPTTKESTREAEEKGVPDAEIDGRSLDLEAGM